MSGRDSRREERDARRDGSGLEFDVSMAFQPIVDLARGRVFAHEALVRGVAGEPAAHVFTRVDAGNSHRFDESCRTAAIRIAAGLAMDSFLSINFMPNAVFRPESCVEATEVAARRYGFPLDRIIFEITEGEKVEDLPRLRSIVEHYHACGFRTAIDDFGAGYSGLNLLAEVRTDYIKLDMGLIRDIDRRPANRAIVRGVVQVARELQTTVIAEGVERPGELDVLQGMGIELLQGYYFAKPAFEALPPVAPDLLVPFATDEELADRLLDTRSERWLQAI